MKNKILLVEGDVDNKNRLVRFFAERDFSMTAVNSEENGLLLMKYIHFDVAIVEFCENGKPADTICKEIRDHADKTGLILMCSHQSPDIERKARQFAPAFYFVKPVNLDDLYAVVLRLFEIKWKKQQQVKNYSEK